MVYKSIIKFASLKDLFGIDIRSLAFLRIATAFIILLDLATRAQNLEAHYTDFGILPRATLFPHILNFPLWSLYFWDGSRWFSIGLFLLTTIFVVMLLVGYQTRWVTVACWILIVSLQNRNRFILQGGDLVLRLILFWFMFLPLADCWSLDCKLKKRYPSQSAVIFSPATVAILLQICMMYWFAMILKSSAVWIKNFSAIYVCLNLNDFVTPFGLFLLKFPEWLGPLTYLTLALELVGPMLPFIPIGNSFFRLSAITLFILFHLIIGLALNIGSLTILAMIVWVLFLPSWFWDRVFNIRKVPLLTFSLLKRTSNLPVRRFIRKTGGQIPSGTQAGDLTLEWNRSITDHKVNTRGLFFVNFFVVVCLGYILLWNIHTIDKKNFRVFESPWVKNFGYFFAIDQTWSMFTPSPPLYNDWYIGEARLMNGKTIDILNSGKPVGKGYPSYQQGVFYHKDVRWRKYYGRLHQRPFEKLRPAYGYYIINQWNKTYPLEEHIHRLRIYYARHQVFFLEENRMLPRQERRLLWSSDLSWSSLPLASIGDPRPF